MSCVRTSVLSILSLIRESSLASSSPWYFSLAFLMSLSRVSLKEALHRTQKHTTKGDSDSFYRYSTFVKGFLSSNVKQVDRNTPPDYPSFQGPLAGLTDQTDRYFNIQFLICLNFIFIYFFINCHLFTEKEKVENSV